MGTHCPVACVVYLMQQGYLNYLFEAFQNCTEKWIYSFYKRIPNKSSFLLRLDETRKSYLSQILLFIKTFTVMVENNIPVPVFVLERQNDFDDTEHINL